MSKHYNLIYRQHAVKRMHERSISEEEVEYVIASGAIIENYPDDIPYPSALLLGHAGAKAVHVVYADDIETRTRIIITVYEPDPKIWQDDLRKRR